MKICSRCKSEKPLSLFYRRGKRYKSQCKECCSLYGKKYYETNKETHNKMMSQHYIENKDRYKITHEIYRKENKEKINQGNIEYIRKRLKKDSFFKLKHNLRVRVKQYIKVKNITTRNSTFDFVGCEPNFLENHIQEQFTHGMSWDNYGKWHIDHKIPLSMAKTEEELYKLCHYTNLQPMWASDNLMKGAKIL